MLVLGYLSHLNQNALRIPPFHTGHLGLLPDTEVNLYLVAPNTAHSVSCELLVSPVNRKPDSLTQITCVMEDKPGVVSHLIEAVSDLKLNIICQESSSINHMNHHLVELLVDWSTSSFSDDKADSFDSTQRDYRNYSSIFPVRSRRSMALFDSIVAHCADVIVFDGNQPRLAFRTIPIPNNESTHGTTTIERDSKSVFGN
jgi:hypothetical protein